MRNIRRLFLRCLRLGHRRKWTYVNLLSDYLRYCRLCFVSLSYNSFTNSDVVIESLFEPIYWLVDHVTRWFGIDSTEWICWHITYGHWNLIMIVFHYYKAITTSPGYPPQSQKNVPSVSVCRKCIAPKPARTHHCSICNRCILKMDHHCPWLNNCVGHYNHRYFFSFCLFMTLGCIYCSISSRVMFRDAYSAIETFYSQTPPPTISFRERMFHKCIIYLWVLCSSVALALGALTLWHAMLITRGETSIERHINKKERKRLLTIGKVNKLHPTSNTLRHCNTAAFTLCQHWITRVILPSSHSAYGDGLTWNPPSWIPTKQTSVVAI
uniref:Palmitoyltransferase n=1 Tax=Pyxicephalus adspersus TaxID=30357 RepID=A0AAV2ZQW2_PYXAD|nr:TPA: hypothetical protein GDO54_004218 [Pyxicephalus adspersus]